MPSGNEEWQWKVLIFSNFQRETSIMVFPSHVWWPEGSHGLCMGPMRPGLAEHHDEKDAWRLPLSSVDHDSPMISAIHFEANLRCTFSHFVIFQILVNMLTKAAYSRKIDISWSDLYLLCNLIYIYIYRFIYMYIYFIIYIYFFNYIYI
jgi:hypothetical protein